MNANSTVTTPPNLDEREPRPASASPVLRQRKPLLSMRIDHDVLEWFRAPGPGYQTRMNAVLRAYMEHTRGERG